MSVYSPGLRVTRAAVLDRERRLPLPGEILVTPGQSVDHTTVVARTYLPGRVEMVNLAGQLGLEPSQVASTLLVGPGEPVEQGRPLARTQGWFGWFRTTLESPLSGTLESVSGVTGQAIVRGYPTPLEVRAYVDGTIERILPGEGVVVRTQGAYLQGIFGIGGETSGILCPVSPTPDHEPEPDCLGPEHAGQILIAGSRVSVAFLRAAVTHQAAAVVVGGIDDEDLRAFLGYDLGVAITGSEEVGLSLILTEGFGPMGMAARSFDLLNECAGRRASLSGATQIRSGVIRPELIVCGPPGSEAKPAESGPASLAPGAPVRIIREPHFGALATVRSLPVEPQPIPSEARVRVAEVELADGQRLVVPRANLEWLQT